MSKEHRQDRDKWDQELVNLPRRFSTPSSSTWKPAAASSTFPTSCAFCGARATQGLVLQCEEGLRPLVFCGARRCYAYAIAFVDQERLVWRWASLGEFTTGTTRADRGRWRTYDRRSTRAEAQPLPRPGEG